MLRRVLVVIGVLWALPASAQTLMVNTTITANVDGVQTSLLVASNTGLVVGNYAWVDLEAFRIVNISGLTVQVVRGSLSTQRQLHNAGATLLSGVRAHFASYPQTHQPPFGRCVRTDQLYLPLIDTTSGNVWSCDLLNKWIGTNIAPLVYNSLQLR